MGYSYKPPCIYTMAEVTEIINIKGYGRNKIFKLLRTKGILNEVNMPEQEFIDEGYFERKEQNLYYPGGNFMAQNLGCKVSVKGIELIKELINSEIKE